EQAEHDVRLALEVEEPSRRDQNVLLAQQIHHPSFLRAHLRQAQHRVPTRVTVQTRDGTLLQRCVQVRQVLRESLQNDTTPLLTQCEQCGQGELYRSAHGQVGVEQELEPTERLPYRRRIAEERHPAE